MPVAIAREAAAAAGAAVARATSARDARSEAAKAWAAFHEERGEHTLFDVQAAAAALEARDRRAEALDRQIDALEADIAAARQAEDDGRQRSDAHRTELARIGDRKADAQARVARLDQRLAQAEVSGAAETPLAAARAALDALLTAATEAEAAAASAVEGAQQRARQRAAAEAELRAARAEEDAAERALVTQATAAAPDWAQGWPERRAERVQALLAAPPDPEALGGERRALAAFESQAVQLRARVDALSGGEAPVSDEAWATILERFTRCSERAEAARDAAIGAARQFDAVEARAPRYTALIEQSGDLDRDLGRLDELGTLLRGDRFVEFVANDHLADLTARATEHLLALTHGRYRLQLDEDLAFVVEDLDAGGAARPVHSLSGGESFLTALALALALSAQVQQRSARPLGFFFLDEGFGTLDPDALDRVMTAIEGLRSEHRLIGLISHVPAVRERVPRYLWVTPASGATGSSIELRDN
ncbi:MAG: SbcC/MukB-like Walker B domain-containing protein [Myxococcota bacterium]